MRVAPAEAARQGESELSGNLEGLARPSGPGAPHLAVEFNPWPPIIALASVVVLGIFLLVTVAAYRRAPRQRTLVAVLALAGGLAAASALYGFAAYQGYRATDTWTFRYTVDIRGNGTQPESLIVPIPVDERLLAGLQRTSGTANWSLVDTPHGRGLDVRFVGSALLQAATSQYPPPEPLPNPIPTMPVYTNCTAQPSNCTGPPQVWIYYSGTAGVAVSLSIGSWIIDADPVPGWGAYARLPAPVPTL